MLWQYPAPDDSSVSLLISLASLLGYLRTTRVECGATSQNSDCRSITSQQRYLRSTSCCLHTAFLQGTLSTAANPPPRLTPIPLLGFFPSKWHSDAWASCGKLRLCLQAMLQATTNSLWGAQSPRPPVQPSPNKGVTMGRAPQSPPAPASRNRQQSYVFVRNSSSKGRCAFHSTERGWV